MPVTVPPPLSAAARPRVGLVLAGGGEVGIAWHAAVLRALEIAGWDPRGAELCIGTSAGSWLTALLRLGIAPAHLVALACDERIDAPDDILSRLGDPVVVPRAPIPWPPWRPAAPALIAEAVRRHVRLEPGVAVAAALPAGRLPSDPVVVPLERVYGDRWPEQQLWLTAVDIDSGKRVVFGRSGDPTARVAQAVAASCAVPGYFTPVVIDGRRYVDGGSHSIANLDLCASAGLDLVVVSSPMSAAHPRRGPGDAAARRFIAARLDRERRMVEAAGTPVVVLAPVAADLEPMGGVARAMDRRRRRPVVDRALETLAARLSRGPIAERMGMLTG